MRAPTDMPRRQPRLPGRGRALIVVGVVVLFLLLTSLRGIAGFYTDYLWFQSLHRTNVFRGVLGAKVALAVIFTGAFFVLLFVNLVIADRLAPPFRPTGPDEEFLERYHELVGTHTGWVRAGMSLLLALIAGAGVSSEWNSWLLFTHGGSFGIKDPQFHKDIGFYVFKLPFLSFVVGMAVRGVPDHPHRHVRGPLPERWDPGRVGGPARHPAGEGPPVGPARDHRPGEGGRATGCSGSTSRSRRAATSTAPPTPT